MKTKEHTVVFSDNTPSRLDLFLVSVFPERSRSSLQNLIKQGEVTVNQKPITKTGYKLETDDVITIHIPPPAPSDLIPEPIPLEIIYEDNNFLAINKQPGMVVHPSAGHDSGTLVHAVLAHAPNIEGVGGVQRPGIVHRLDKDTSGIILVAKNDRTHNFLQAQFKDRQVKKKYLALVDDHPPTTTGRIEAAIGRDAGNRQKMAIVTENKGRMAITEYRTVETFNEHTFLEIRILTGRTHQIRLHCAFVGCPVVGDRVYGRRSPSLPVTRQMLHAHQITIRIPGKEAPVSFTAPIPTDISDQLDYLREQR